MKGLYMTLQFTLGGALQVAENTIRMLIADVFGQLGVRGEPGWLKSPFGRTFVAPKSESTVKTVFVFSQCPS